MITLSPGHTHTHASFHHHLMFFTNEREMHWMNKNSNFLHPHAESQPRIFSRFHLFKPGIRMMAGKIVIRAIWQYSCARGRFTLFRTVCVVSCMNTRVRRTLADFVLAFGPPNLEFEAKLTNLAGSLPPFWLWFTYHLHSIQWWSRFAFLSFHCYSFSFFRWAMCVSVRMWTSAKAREFRSSEKKTEEKNKINKKTNKKYNQNTDKKESTNTNKRKKSQRQLS